MAMLSPSKQLKPNRKDHELFIFPKKKNKTPFTRSRNKSYQQATQSEDSTTAAKVASDFISPEMFSKADSDQKLASILTSLNKLHSKFDTINTELYRDKDGVWPRLETAEDNLATTMDTQEMMKFEMAVMKGVIQKQEVQIGMLTKKVEDLTARSMSSNITISGLIVNDSDENEDCTATVVSFAKNKIGIDIEKDDILVAHRVGPINKFGERLMVVRCTQKLKDKMLSNAKNLSTKVNSQKRKFFVNSQVPESVLADKKMKAHQIKMTKEQNKSLPDTMKHQFYVKNKILYIDEVPQTKTVATPSFSDLIPDQQEQEKMEKIKLWYSESKSENGNIFTAIATKVSGAMEVNRAYRRIKQLYPSASHIPVGYDFQKQQGSHDDGEYQAGLVIQKTLISQNAVNKAIFVVRQASGKKLGPKRFQIIEETVLDVIAKI